MQVKLLEIRDRMTCIPCFAFNCQSKPATHVFPDVTFAEQANDHTERENKILRHTGYSPHGPTIMFGRLDDGSDTMNDAYCHRGAPLIRTMSLAHEFITIHWDTIDSGDIIDVEYNEDESEVKKTTQYP